MVQEFGIFGGDVINNDGTSGETIYGMVFRDENYTIMHDQKYLLSLTKPGKREHTNNSQFMITLSALPFLDYKYQVFGRVDALSMALIDYIEFFAGTKAWDKIEPPVYNVKITGCQLTSP